MIDRISGGRSVGETRRAGRVSGQGSFRVEDDPATAATSATGSAAAPSLVAVLAMQQGEQEAAQDRAARRGGEDVLDALGGLQRDLLGGGASLGRLRDLAALSDAAIPAADRRLRDVLAAVAVRAKVELARYERAPPPRQE